MADVVSRLKESENNLSGRRILLARSVPNPASLIRTGTEDIDDFPGLHRALQREPSEYSSNYPSILNSIEHPDGGEYVDVYDYRARLTHDDRKKLESSPPSAESPSCPLTDNEYVTLKTVFTLLTGMDTEGSTPDGEDYRELTYEEMLTEINNVRAFLGGDLNRTLGLKGIMAELNKVLFLKEIEQFDEHALMAYAMMFHIDLTPLDLIQESLGNSYLAYLSSPGVTEDDLKKRQEDNLKVYLRELQMVILQFKFWMLDRLRLWRWREEVLLGGVSAALDVYPGVSIIHEYETATELLELGITNYYPRVGEATREILMDRFNYFDLYHMAGILSAGVMEEVKFHNEMNYEDMADLVILLLEQMPVDPRHILTPLGVQIIFNRERGEAIYNFKQKETYDSAYLELACSHAGIPLQVETTDIDEDGTVTLLRDHKPQFVLAEELMSQYLSPQFYTGIEGHRHYLSALQTFVTLSGQRVNYGDDGDFLFYGLGDGLSFYRVYTPTELAISFSTTRAFIDPYSLGKHPLNPQKWSSFSLQSIERLVKIVLPQLRIKSRSDGKIRDSAPTIEEIRAAKEKGRPDIDGLEDIIVEIMAGMDQKKEVSIGKTEHIVTLGKAIEPRVVQELLVSKLRNNIEAIRRPLSVFLAFLFNTGVWFSDWSETVIHMDEEAVQTGIASYIDWKDIDPETTSNLRDNILKLLTYYVEKYINIVGSDDENYTSYVKGLRWIKFYEEGYRIDWNDELATIEGSLYRMVKANELGYYDYIRAYGNWMMSTSNYYSVLIFDQALGEQEFGLVGKPVQPEDFVVF